MAHSADGFSVLVQSILHRVEKLEARTARLEDDLRRGVPGNNSPGGNSATGTLAEAESRWKAVDEYRRRERLAHLRAPPDFLAALRDDLARLNAFLAERGLPLQADRYPEL